MGNEHWACPTGHISTVARFPNAEGVRRCYFCPEIVTRVELVPAEQPQGAVDALWRIADYSLPPEHDDLREYAVSVLQELGVDLATYRPEGQ